MCDDVGQIRRMEFDYVDFGVWMAKFAIGSHYLSIGPLFL